VIVDIAQDPLADLGMALHLSALLERQWSRLLEQTGWKTDLADVVDEPAKADELLPLLRQSHALGDVAGIDRHGGRVTRGVLIPCVERRYKGGREGEASPP